MRAPAVALAVVLAGCCTIPRAAVLHARKQAAVFDAVADDDSLTDEARDVARVAHIAWEAQRYLLEGGELDPDVRAALEAAGALEADGDAGQ